MNGKRRQHIYQVGRWVFVPHPMVKGAWLRTDASVLVVDCGYCGAKKGQLCRGKTPSGITAGTHSDRRGSAVVFNRRLAQKAKAEHPATVLHVDVPLAGGTR